MAFSAVLARGKSAMQSPPDGKKESTTHARLCPCQSRFSLCVDEVSLLAGTVGKGAKSASYSRRRACASPFENILHGVQLDLLWRAIHVDSNVSRGIA